MQGFVFLSQFGSWAMFGLSGIGALQAALTICFFLVILFGQPRIKSPILFRLAFFFLVLSVVFPPIASLAVIGSPAGGNFGATAEISIYAFGSLPGPLLIGASMLMAFLSLAIGPQQGRLPSPTSPDKHPLDN